MKALVTFSLPLLAAMVPAGGSTSAQTSTPAPILTCTVDITVDGNKYSAFASMMAHARLEEANRMNQGEDCWWIVTDSCPCIVDDGFDASTLIPQCGQDTCNWPSTEMSPTPACVNMCAVDYTYIEENGRRGVSYRYQPKCVPPEEVASKLGECGWVIGDSSDCDCRDGLDRSMVEACAPSDCGARKENWPAPAPTPAPTLTCTIDITVDGNSYSAFASMMAHNSLEEAKRMNQGEDCWWIVTDSCPCVVDGKFDASTLIPQCGQDTCNWPSTGVLPTSACVNMCAVNYAYIERNGRTVLSYRYQPMCVPFKEVASKLGECGWVIGDGSDCDCRDGIDQSMVEACAPSDCGARKENRPAPAPTPAPILTCTVEITVNGNSYGASARMTAHGSLEEAERMNQGEDCWWIVTDSCTCVVDGGFDALTLIPKCGQDTCNWPQKRKLRGAQD